MLARKGNAHAVDTLPTKMLRTAGKEAHVDYHAKEEYRPNTAMDNEIDRARAAGRPISMDAAFPNPPHEDEGLGGTPGAVPDAVKNAVSRHTSEMGSYSRTYQLRLLHRMMLRNLPDTAIASAMGISVKRVSEMKGELRAQLRKQAHKIDMPTHVGSALAFYEEVRGVAMQIATDAKHATGARVGALGVALEAQKDTVRFLQAIGAYQANPMKWGNEDDATVQQGMLLQEMAEAFLTGGDDPVLLTANSDGTFTQEEEEDIRLINGV